MNRLLALLIGSLVLIGGLVALLARRDAVRPRGGQVGAAQADRSVMLFCAASNRAVMESIRSEYESETGRSVQIQYGPSQTLLSSMEVSRKGDLYLPADDSYLKMAAEKGLVQEVLPVAKMKAVIAIKKGNPEGIKTLSDLMRDDVRLVQADPEGAAIGKVVRRVLRESKQWQGIDQATKAYRTTVTDVANDLVLGAADAGFVYDAVLHTYPDLSFVEIPEFAQTESTVAIGVTSDTGDSQMALHFARYVAAKDRGLKHYGNHGFRAEGGDAWDDAPELSIFAGSMLRPAIEETIAEFEIREGVRVNRVYNGCGILVGQMKSGQRPDAYFACDTEFMDQVNDIFPEPVDVSQNELVILVKKGNPFNIASLKDLTRPDIRVGIGHEKQCAMGWLTQNTLTESGLQKEVMENVVTKLPTGDMLVNQLRAGSLDAAVVYLSNAAGSAEELEAHRIEGLSCSIATQPWAVSTESKFPQTASRLFQKICAAKSREVFEAEGFRWTRE